MLVRRSIATYPAAIIRVLIRLLLALPYMAIPAGSLAAGSAVPSSLNSPAENFPGLAMHAVDEIAAYRDLVEEGIDAKNIAAQFGQSGYRHASAAQTCGLESGLAGHLPYDSDVGRRLLVTQ